LRGTSVEYLLRDKDSLNRKFMEVVLPIVKKKPEFWPGYTLECFMNAASIITSRAFHDDAENQTNSGPFLVPVGDLLNHSLKHKSVDVIREADGSFKMIAHRNLIKGEEVYMIYGELSNAQLLHSYGFVENDNPHDNVLLEMKLIYEVISSYLKEENLSKRNDFLKSVNMLHDCIVISKEDMLPEELLSYIRLMIMSDEIFELYKNIIPNIPLEEELDPNNLLEIYGIVCAIIEARLKQYPTSIQEDISLIKGSNDQLSITRKKCSEYQIGRKTDPSRIETTTLF